MPESEERESNVEESIDLIIRIAQRVIEIQRTQDNKNDPTLAHNFQASQMIPSSEPTLPTLATNSKSELPSMLGKIYPPIYRNELQPSTVVQITQTATSRHLQRPQEFAEILELLKVQEQTDKETDLDFSRLIQTHKTVDKQIFNSLRYRYRSNFETELWKFKLLRKNAWKLQFIKQKQSSEEQIQYCDRLIQSLAALQSTLLCTIQAYMQQKNAGMQQFHAYKIHLWANDDAQSVREQCNLSGSDKDIVSFGRQKASEVLCQKTEDIIVINEPKKIAENLVILFK
ncbi:MAG: hypothetical protein EZS28_051922, partial [Streblomastix strix]